jgi:hypothetical protein
MWTVRPAVAAHNSKPAVRSCPREFLWPPPDLAVEPLLKLSCWSSEISWWFSAGRSNVASQRRSLAVDLALPSLATCLKAMALVKPATVVQSQGFGKYRRWRSKSRGVGLPGVNREIRELIRQMSTANPLWGAPRIHCELLKLGIEVSQATVGRYVIRRQCSASPIWRSFPGRGIHWRQPRR